MHLIHSFRNKLQLPAWLCFRFPAPLLNMKTLIRAANKGSNSPTATRRALKGTISGQRHFEPVSPSQALFPQKIWHWATQNLKTGFVLVLFLGGGNGLIVLLRIPFHIFLTKIWHKGGGSTDQIPSKWSFKHCLHTRLEAASLHFTWGQQSYIGLV